MVRRTQSNPNNLGYVIIETATTSDRTDLPETKLIKKRDDGRVLAEGVLQEANMKNRNGRWYDSRDLFPELIAPRQQELLRTGNMRGENGHPLSKDLVRQQTIDPNNTVCIYTKFWTEDNFVMGQYFGTYNDKGEEFNTELENGMLPSFSLRALGTIQNTGRGAEVKGIKIITYDRVIYPSHDKAYTRGLVQEGSLLVPEGNNLVLEESDAGLVIPITNDEVINYINSQSLNIKQIRESFDLLYDDIKLVKNKSQVQLTDKAGGIFVVNLESYIHNEIMDACLENVGRK